MRHILKLDREGKFLIAPEDEDCHTAIEKHLVAELGDLGKKIHTARSRNDQVVTALRLYARENLRQVEHGIDSCVRALRARARKLSRVKMPGYTHARKAMPSSFASWLEAFAQSMHDNKITTRAAYNLLDQNPLGAGAG